MAKISGDERREVARKIREYVDAYGDGIEDAEMVLLGTVWGRDNRGDVVRPTSEEELLSMLADLIDPTCHIVTVEDCDGDLTEVHDCCGDKHTRDAFAGRVLPYCPYCGSRVVSGDAN